MTTPTPQNTPSNVDPKNPPPGSVVVRIPPADGEWLAGRIDNHVPRDPSKRVTFFKNVDGSLYIQYGGVDVALYAPGKWDSVTAVQ